MIPQDFEQGAHEEQMRTRSCLCATHIGIQTFTRQQHLFETFVVGVHEGVANPLRRLRSRRTLGQYQHVFDTANPVSLSNSRARQPVTPERARDR